ncbi:MAG: hypothetical protein LAQ30_23375 [Acidobacteriia bacterium]|nr:hypothetical protein [Terriglobia bacterium]
MRLLLRFRDGSLQAAILMALFGSHLRVFIPACDDAVEFRWAGGQWQAENGEPVEIQFNAAREEFHWSAQAALDQPMTGPNAPGSGFWSPYWATAPSAAHVD